MALSGVTDGYVYDKAIVHDTGSEKSTDEGGDASSQASESDDQAVNRARIHDHDVNHVGSQLCEALLEDDDNDADFNDVNGASESLLPSQLCEALLEDDDNDADFNDVNGASEALLPSQLCEALLEDDDNDVDFNDVNGALETLLPSQLCEALLEDDDNDDFNDVNGASEALLPSQLCEWDINDDINVVNGASESPFPKHVGSQICEALLNDIDFDDVKESSEAPPLPLRLMNSVLGNASDSQEENLDPAKTQIKAEFLKRIGLSSLNSLDSDGKSALHRAAKEGNGEVAQALLDDDCFELVNAKETNLLRWTALHEAANANHVHIVNMIVNCDRFTQTNTPDRNGRNCLHFAAEKGYLEVVEAIVSDPRFAGTGMKDYHGFTPQKRAKINGHEAIVEYIQARIPLKKPPHLGLKYMRSMDIRPGIVLSL